MSIRKISVPVPKNTLELISKIQSHPKFDTLPVLTKQEFDGATYIWSDPTSSEYTKAEERKFFVKVWKRLCSNCEK